MFFMGFDIFETLNLRLVASCANLFSCFRCNFRAENLAGPGKTFIFATNINSLGTINRNQQPEAYRNTSTPI